MILTSKYIIIHGQLREISDDELMHYGVKGMQWGVRRATKRLRNASTKEERDKAIASLNKHQAKITKKIEKLNRNRPELEKAYTKALVKIDPKIAKLEQKKAKLSRRAGGLFTSDKKAQKLLAKSQVMDLKIQGLKGKSDTAKAAIAKNDRMNSLFKQGLSDVNSALASAGRKYMNG